MKIITLNIQGGFKLEEISREIDKKLTPFDILALQEIKVVDGNKQMDKIMSTLGNQYRFIDWYPTTFLEDEYGKMGNTTIFSSKLKNVDKKLIKIPDYSPGFFWRLLRLYFLPTQKLAISIVFSYKNKKVRLTNLHLEYAGDTKTRSRQLNYLLKKLNKENFDIDILVGDFNTIGKLDRKIPELRVLENEGYILASSNLKWTADGSHPDPNWYPYPIFKFFYKLGFKMRQNLDHVLVKGKVESVKCKKVKINSSDHDAVVCEIEF